MQLAKPGWLQPLLEDVVGQHTAELNPVLWTAVEPFRPGRGRARAYLRAVLRHTGLVYGTPTRPPDLPGMHEQGTAGEQLFLAVLRTLCGVALDVAVVADAAPGPRREQLLMLLAASIGRVEEAEEIQRRIARAKEWPLPRRLWERIEGTLARRAPSLSGDPYYGVVLHNGTVYADAHQLGRQAIDYFAAGQLDPEVAAQRHLFAASQKAVLVSVLTALVCADRRPAFPARRAILQQVDDLDLPDDLRATLRRQVKRSFERRPDLAELLAPVRSQDMRRFILEQTLLASLVDGRRSRREVAFVQELSGQLGFGPNQVRQVEVEMAEFYARNRHVVDVFTVTAGAELMGEELVDSMQRTLEKNFQRLLQEVRETGELSVLLARAARGHSLTSDEKRRMREQLIDVAKAIPALAIFAAPGGVLLLIALAKVLPFNLLPSAFRDEAGNESSGSVPPRRR